MDKYVAKKQEINLKQRGSESMKKYTNELEGQREFLVDYLKLINNSLTIEEVLQDYSDGVINGCLLEFKLQINDLNTVLFQAVKYLSARRVKGKPVPAKIVLISLNDATAYPESSVGQNLFRNNHHQHKFLPNTIRYFSHSQLKCFFAFQYCHFRH